MPICKLFAWEVSRLPDGRVLLEIDCIHDNRSHEIVRVTMSADQVQMIGNRLQSALAVS